MHDSGASRYNRISNIRINDRTEAFNLIASYWTRQTFRVPARLALSGHQFGVQNL